MRPSWSSRCAGPCEAKRRPCCALESVSKQLVKRFDIATQLLERGKDIRPIQEWLDHSDVLTTVIYTRVLNRAPYGVQSPADVLLPHEHLVLGPAHVPLCHKPILAKVLCWSESEEEAHGPDGFLCGCRAPMKGGYRTHRNIVRRMLHDLLRAELSCVFELA